MTTRLLCRVAVFPVVALLTSVPALADYVIYVPGAQSIIPSTPLLPITSVPVTDTFNGAFNPGNTVQIIDYPASFGWLNTLTWTGSYPIPTFNQSVAIGVTNLDAQIKADQAANPNEQIDVIGISLGAIVGTVEAQNLTAAGPSSYKNVTFILAGNPDRVGGVANVSKLSIPGALTVGHGVLSTPPPTNGPKIVDVANPGDPVASFTPANVAGFLVDVVTGKPLPHNYVNTVVTPSSVTAVKPAHPASAPALRHHTTTHSHPRS